MISLQQGFFRSIRTTICESPHHRFQAHLVFLLPRFKPPSLRRQLPLLSSVNLAYLKEYEGEGPHDFDKGRDNKALKQNVEKIGINFDSCIPGQYTLLICPSNVIAYTYRRKGELVNCKFRSITSRKFWQAKHGERILYGLDGIKEGNDIVIVEGEIDKLSMEEAGIMNCVSVPDGAPQQVSTKSKKQEIRFKYLSDCNGYLDKASRIILATDCDGPGQALAEELSCRLGKQRCWVVTWPKKDEVTRYKDANEVLVHLGPEALRHIVENAKLYEAQKIHAD
ncbi:hypothetical protein L2E82_29791 [Cichorium intybus]|uniref:Uncharacterized protein n=1 Tax=Cichorium intybus TaxID=13427 RepID=A0ACB9CYH7_CICIN|nr:hypothetical protein L2E82_29791 [Cichorium intybus]